MTALFWLAVSLAALAGYVHIGRRIGLAAGRRAYDASQRGIARRHPILVKDTAWCHEHSQEAARFAYWPSVLFWPVAVVVMLAIQHGEPIDFSPDGKVLQQRIRELENELGMRP